MAYSQNNEEQVILKYFNGYVGTLLDCGANDGVTFSNSRQLLLNGWGGYLFEPSEVAQETYSLYRDNENVTVYHCGIGGEQRDIEFYESGAHVPNGSDRALVSTGVISELKRWAGVKFEKKKVFIRGFDKWWVDELVPKIDFITIDIEGMEWELLQAINLTEVGCKCLCIEWNRRRDLERLFTQYCANHNMTEIHRNAENIIFAV